MYKCLFLGQNPSNVLEKRMFIKNTINESSKGTIQYVSNRTHLMNDVNALYLNVPMKINNDGEMILFISRIYFCSL